MDVTAKEIDRWHRARGYLKIGYHYLIRRSGLLETGRKPDEPGAHAKGYNNKSIGVCLAGGCDRLGRPSPEYTPEQWAALKELLDQLKAQFPKAKIVGHNEVDEKAFQKACPSFDVQAWLADGSVIPVK